MDDLSLCLLMDELLIYEFEGENPTKEQIEAWGYELKEMIDRSVEKMVADLLEPEKHQTFDTMIER